MATAAQLMTAEDLWNLPADGQRHELVKGELITMAPAGFEHGAIAHKLSFALAQIVQAKKLGVLVLSDTGFLIQTNPDTVRAADIAFVAQNRLSADALPKKYFPGAPDLAVEVVSPSDRVNDLDDKVDEWLAAGSRAVWVVNPRRRTVTVHVPDAQPRTFTGDDVLDGGEVVPGFQCRVGDLFV